MQAFPFGLWRVITSGLRARQSSVQLSPSREPHSFRLSRPLDQAMADSLTVITRSRIFEMVLRRKIMEKEARQS